MRNTQVHMKTRVEVMTNAYRIKCGRGKNRFARDMKHLDGFNTTRICKCVDAMVVPRSMILKPGWDVYSENVNSFCQIFLKNANITASAEYASMNSYWMLFVAPTINYSLGARRNNLVQAIRRKWVGGYSMKILRAPYLVLYSNIFCSLQCFPLSADASSATGPLSRTCIEKLEALIKGKDVDSFYKDSALRNWYVGFLHGYAILATNKKVAESGMNDVGEPKIILDFLTTNQEAFVFLVMVNNHDGWQRRMESDPNDKIRKTNVGRWTQNNNKKEYQTADGGDPKSSSVRLNNSSGWSEEGMKFYSDSVDFFNKERVDERHQVFTEEVLEWYTINVIVPRQKGEGNGRSKRKRVVLRSVEKAADYSEWCSDQWALQP